jgi:hypothetical protein
MTRDIALKVRGQRISEKDLIKESQNALRTAGVPNHHRGLYISDAAAEVVGNPLSLFSQLQRKPAKKPLSPAWIRAYQIVLAYLATVAERPLELTRKTIELEFNNINEVIPRSDIGLTDFDNIPSAPALQFDGHVAKYMKIYAPKVEPHEEVEPPPPVEVPPESSPRPAKRSARGRPSPRSGRKPKAGT